MVWVRLFDLDNAGSNIAAKIAMTAITTSTSTKLNPFFFPLFMAPVCRLGNVLRNYWNLPARPAHKTSVKTTLFSYHPIIMRNRAKNWIIKKMLRA